MAGSILGPDQVRKVNEAFPRLLAHIQSLLNVDHSAVGLMKVHAMVESFDSDQMALIFKELSFIMPAEKKALVRAAIYQIMSETPQVFVSDYAADASVKPAAPVVFVPTTYTPPPFRLNVATTNGAEAEKLANPSVNQAVDQHTSTVQRKLEKLNQEAGPKTLAEVSKAEDAKLVKRRSRKPKS